MKLRRTKKTVPFLGQPVHSNGLNFYVMHINSSKRG